MDKVKKREIDFDTLEQDLKAQWVEIANITKVIIAKMAKWNVFRVSHLVFHICTESLYDECIFFSSATESL